MRQKAPEKKHFERPEVHCPDEEAAEGVTLGRARPPVCSLRASQRPKYPLCTYPRVTLLVVEVAVWSSVWMPKLFTEVCAMISLRGPFIKSSVFREVLQGWAEPLRGRASGRLKLL